jgi:Cutinase
MFGDPMNGSVIKGFPSSKIITYCKSGDEVCQGEFNIKATHLTYGTEVGSAVKAIKEALDASSSTSESTSKSKSSSKST